MQTVPFRQRIRSVIGGLFRRPMIRAKDQFLSIAKTACAETQRQTLQRLLALNAGSQFSNDHGLSKGLTIAEFQKRVPVSDYETFRPYIDRMQKGDHRALLGADNRLLMFATSSGTTAAPKLIPITEQFVKDYRRGWQHWGIAAHQDHPLMRQSRMVQIISKHDRFRTADGTPCGNISGLVTAMQRRIVRKLYAVPAAVCEIECPETKRNTVAQFAYADPWVGMFVTANPSTLLQLITSACPDTLIRNIHDGSLPTGEIPAVTRTQLQRFVRPNPIRAAELQTIVEHHGHLQPSACWPNLTCLGVWSGGSAGTYIPQLQKAFGDVSCRDHGLHASEGRMTIPFSDSSPVGLLDIESHFFEFLPLNEANSDQPIVLQAHELEEDTDYFILLTTSSGLYRYNIFDVVRCTGFYGTTPLLEFRHKGEHMSSITGEKISESQVVEAISAVETTENVGLNQFTLTPVWGEPPHYRLFVEVDGKDRSSFSAATFAKQCDAQLRQRNCEYDEKRDSQRIGIIQCHVLNAANWIKFRNNRLAASGGSPEQYKHPCLLPDAQFEDKFISTAGIERQ